MDARSVTVSSQAEGLIAKTDLIEAEGGAVVPARLTIAGTQHLG